MGDLAQVMDDNHNPIPNALAPGVSQDVAFDGSVQSTAFISGTRMVRLVATQACRIAFGVDPTAGAAGLLLPANVVEYFKTHSGYKVAALKQSSAGSLNVTELG
jgi:hypothetical protein